MPPASAGTPRRDDCSQRHCRTRDEHPNLGQPELNSNYQSPPGPLSPAQADYRLTVARLKDALRAPAYAGQILDPAARSHEPAAIGESATSEAATHARKTRSARETPGHSHLTPARFFRDDLGASDRLCK